VTNNWGGPSARLRDSLLRNKQRIAIQKLRRDAGAILPETVEFRDAVASRKLNEKVLDQLHERRPSERGELLITRDEAKFKKTIGNYFAARSDLWFDVFLARWVETGALTASGADLSGRVFDLLSFDGDSVYGSASDGGEVFLLDRTLGDEGVVLELFFFASTTLTSS